MNFAPRFLAGSELCYLKKKKVSISGVLNCYSIILIPHQPIDRYDSYNFVTRRQAPLPGGKPACSRFPRLTKFYLPSLSIERCGISIRYHLAIRQPAGVKVPSILLEAETSCSAPVPTANDAAPFSQLFVSYQQVIFSAYLPMVL